MAKPSITYKVGYTSTGVGNSGLGVSVQTDRWFVRDAYGVLLAEVYDRKLMLHLAEHLGIKEAGT